MHRLLLLLITFLSGIVTINGQQTIGNTKFDVASAYVACCQQARNNVLYSYLSGQKQIDSLSQITYKRLSRHQQAGRVEVMQIFLLLPQNVTAATLRKATLLMDSLYLQASDSACFMQAVSRYSADKQPRWIDYLQMPVEFEERVFNMQPGEVTAPFMTPLGIHIVRVLRRQPFPSYDRMRPLLQARVLQTSKNDWTSSPLRQQVEKLRCLLHLDSLVNVNVHDDNNVHDDYIRFVSAHPMGSRQLRQAFVTKSVLDYAADHLSSISPQLDIQWKAEAGRLLQQTIREQIALDTTSADLEQYFSQHRSAYPWPVPHYRGAVIHCATKRIAKRVRRFLKKLPYEEWEQAVRLAVNADEKQDVLYEQGNYVIGDQPFVDHKAFDGPRPAPLATHPYTLVLGHIQKYPQSYREVEKQVRTDYQNHCLQQWITYLKTKSKVEIDQEVLKTINNH